MRAGRQTGRAADACAPEREELRVDASRSRGRDGRCDRSSSRRPPSAPAMTRHADARRSVAITFAPVRRGTPRTVAALPSTSMSAPSRRSSCTCIMRFSKIVSVTTDVPAARVASAIICACMSVGNAGYGAVVDAGTAPARRCRGRGSRPAASSVDRRAGLAKLVEHRIAAMPRSRLRASRRRASPRRRRRTCRSRCGRA